MMTSGPSGVFSWRARAKSFARNKMSDTHQNYSIHFILLCLLHTLLIHLQVVVMCTLVCLVIHKMIHDVRLTSFTVPLFLDSGFFLRTFLLNRVQIVENSLSGP